MGLGTEFRFFVTELGKVPRRRCGSSSQRADPSELTYLMKASSSAGQLCCILTFETLVTSAILQAQAPIPETAIRLETKSVAFNEPFAIDHTSPDWFLSDGVDGFEFVPRRDLLVSSLGWYDHNADGLVHRHPVAIYEVETEEQIALVAVTGNSAIDEDTHFRYEAVESPVTLLAGNAYCICGWSGVGPNYDAYLYPQADRSRTVTTNASISFQTYRSAPSSSGLTFPRFILTPSDNRAVWYGANFQFTAVSPPADLEITDIQVSSGEGTTIRWSPIDDGVYTVEESDDLETWRVLEEGLEMATYADPTPINQLSQRYYRVMAGHQSIEIPAFETPVFTPTNADLEGREQPVDEDDLAILLRASRLLPHASVWSQNDDRLCEDDEESGVRSLFCALQKASIDVLGVYNHRRTALQEVRFAIEQVTNGRQFAHRLKDFNNLSTTDLRDVREVLQIATDKVRARLPEPEPMPGPILNYDATVLLETTSQTSANVSIGDVNDDGHQDIVLAKGRHWPLMNRVLIGDGKGGFSSASNLGDEADRSYFGQLYDMDGDGDLDVVVSNDEPDTNKVYLNDGSGSFEVSSLFGETAWKTRNASIADMNGDGLPDIIVANRSSNPRSGGTGGSNYICLNQGDGNFEGECIAFSHYSATTITPADFNGDGLMDLAVPHRDGGQSHVFIQRKSLFSDLDFRRVPFGPSNASVRASQAADFNGDGRVDIVTIDTSRRELRVYYQEADETYTTGIRLGGTSSTPYALLVEDLNGDQRPDIIIGHPASAPHRLLQRWR